MDEKLLRSAAAISCERFADSLVQDYETDEVHLFSHTFEQKLRKLKRKADHPFLYSSIRRIAAVFLAILIGFGVWLTVDASARAAVSGWIRETYKMFFVYRYAEEKPAVAEMRHYRLTWIPDGYTEYKTVELNGNVTVQYIGANEKRLRFSYTSGSRATDWFIDTTDTVHSTVYIDGRESDLFVSERENVSSILLWTSDSGDAFYICGFLPKEALIKIAESVEPEE